MSTSAVIRAVRRVAERQHGRVTWRQLVDAGATRDQVRRWTHHGWLTREHTGVYLLGARPRSRTGSFCSALLALGGDAALSYRAAAAHWELTTQAVPIEVTVPTASGRTHRDGIIVHRADIPAGHVNVRHGLRVTSLVRTHLDLAGVLTPRELDRMFEQAQVRHHLKPEILAAEAICRRGCRATVSLKALLAGAVDPEAVASVLELRFLALCDRHDLPRPLVNEPLGPWTPDFWWPEHRLVVETDGDAFHRTVAARRRDAAKDAWLRAQGITVIRLTWHDVTERPDQAAAGIHTALAKRAPAAAATGSTSAPPAQPDARGHRSRAGRQGRAAPATATGPL